MKTPLRWYDLITVNVYFVGLTALSQTMTPLVLPLLVQRFAGEAAQGRLYGNLRLWGLMTAVLVQAAAGMLSDRYRGRWGRRRPFILAGTLLDLLCIVGIAYAATLEGMSGYRLLFAVFILLMTATNIAHGPQQGLIPDLVPPEQRGLFSGGKALMEVPVPLMLVAFTIGPLVGRGRLNAALLALGGILLGTMALTMLVRERPLSRTPGPFPRRALLRLAAMTAAFALSILAGGALVSGLIRRSPQQNLLSALWILGSLGLLAMCLAIGAGTWLSVRIALGGAAQRNPAFTWWVVNRLAFLTGSTNLAGFTLYFFQGRLGFPQEQAAIPASRMLLLVGALMLFTVIPGGRLADRWGARRLMAGSALTAAAGTALLLAAPRLAVVYLGAALVGMSTGVFYAANWALGTKLVPQGEGGRYLGISNLAGAGAGAVGAYIGGPIADYFARYHPQNASIGYVLLFGLFGCLFLLSALAARRIRIPSAPLANGLEI